MAAMTPYEKIRPSGQRRSIPPEHTQVSWYDAPRLKPHLTYYKGVELNDKVTEAKVNMSLLNDPATSWKQAWYERT